MSQNRNSLLEIYEVSKRVPVSGENIVPYIVELTKYMHENGVYLYPWPKLTLAKNKANANEDLGKTAYYAPSEQRITLYTEGRHIKDILRSYAHECVHHSQNLRGEMKETESLADPNYAQNDKKMRSLEEEAYTKGNMLFRDWENTRSSKA